MTIPAQSVDEILKLFETLAPSHVAQLSQWYTPEARFKDPFKQVQGVEPIAAIFQHMFEVLENPRFIITNRILESNQCFVVWDFVFRYKTMQRGVDQQIHGGSHLVFKAGDDGVWRIDLHRDYWDAAEEMYEKFPVIGSLMRWLKNKVNS